MRTVQANIEPLVLPIGGKIAKLGIEISLDALTL